MQLINFCLLSFNLQYQNVIQFLWYFPKTVSLSVDALDLFSLLVTLHAVLNKFTFQGLSLGVNMVRCNSLEGEAVHASGVAEDFCQTTEFISLSFIKVFEISVSA